MQIRYKIVEAWPTENSIVVRFYTENLSEKFLGGVDAKGGYTRGRTDYNINLPTPTPTGDALHRVIMQYAPLAWLAMQEQIVASGGVNLSGIPLHQEVTAQAVVVTGGYTVPPAPLDAKTALLLKIDKDVDDIYAATIGNRGPEYDLAETDAKAYKDAGYTGTVPASVSSWATAKNQTAHWAADDILTTATGWRTAQALLRAQRLAKKEAARAAADDGAVATIAAQWTAFVTAIRSQLGIA